VNLLLYQFLKKEKREKRKKKEEKKKKSKLTYLCIGHGEMSVPILQVVPVLVSSTVFKEGRKEGRREAGWHLTRSWISYIPVRYLCAVLQ